MYCDTKFNEISTVFRKNGGAAKSCEQIRFSHVHNTMMCVFKTVHFSFHFSNGAKKKEEKKKLYKYYKYLQALLLSIDGVQMWYYNLCSQYITSNMLRTSDRLLEKKNNHVAKSNQKVSTPIGLTVLFFRLSRRIVHHEYTFQKDKWRKSKSSQTGLMHKLRPKIILVITVHLLISIQLKEY